MMDDDFDAGLYDPWVKQIRSEQMDEQEPK